MAMFSCHGDGGGGSRRRLHDDDMIDIISGNDDSDDASEAEDDGSNGPPEKKVRVSTAAVHKEFEEVKDMTGKWSSKCRHCLIKDTVYKHKNSSALLIHLEKKHPAIYKKCREADEKERVEKERERKGKELQVRVGSSSSGHTTAAKALFANNNSDKRKAVGPMDKYMQSGKQSLPGWKQEMINKKYAYWLGASGLPVSAVTDDSNFKDFIAEINPEVKLPSRFKVMKECSILAQEVQAKIRRALEKAKKVSVTVDIWSSAKCKNSYIGITVHLFNHETLKREAYRIACRKFDVPHTGENIARKIHSIMCEYGIGSKVFYCLSDNGSNMKKGLRLITEESDILDEDLDEDFWDVWDDKFECEEADDDNSEDEDNSNNNDQEEEEDIEMQVADLERDQREHRSAFNRVGLKRLGCFPHTFQLAILKSTTKKRNSFGKMLKKTRNFVVKYRRSSKAKAVLQKTEFKKRLLGYCKTRWWTDQLMIERLCEAMECEQVPGPLDVVVDTMDWPQSVVLTERDYQYMKAYTNMMEPMMEKSDQLGAETFSTIHMVYPTLMEIIAHLDEISRKPLCKTLATDLKKNIKFYFKYLTDPLDINFDPIVITATYLSPVHRHILNEDQNHIAEDHIKTLLESYAQEVGAVAPIGETGDVEGELEEDESITIPGLKFLSKKIIKGTKSPTSDPSAALKQDLDQYNIKSKQVINKLMKSASHKEGEQGEMKTKKPGDPMDFWVKEMGQFETELPFLALDVMAVPASSVPSERLFSISGLLSSGLELS